MLRVVPSQVIDFIDVCFPDAAPRVYLGCGPVTRPPISNYG